MIRRLRDWWRKRLALKQLRLTLEEWRQDDSY